jgi:hypothetical protein
MKIGDGSDWFLSGGAKSGFCIHNLSTEPNPTYDWIFIF